MSRCGGCIGRPPLHGADALDGVSSASTTTPRSTPHACITAAKCQAAAPSAHPNAPNKGAGWQTLCRAWQLSNVNVMRSNVCTSPSYGWGEGSVRSGTADRSHGQQASSLSPRVSRPTASLEVGQGAPTAKHATRRARLGFRDGVRCGLATRSR
jgi:hypothetical protein